MNSCHTTIQYEYNEYVPRLILTNIALAVFLLSVVAVAHASSVSPPGMGFGKCHSAGPQLNDSGAVNWYYNGGYEESWKEFEPTRGQYRFDNWNRWLARVLQTYPDAYVWLNVHSMQQDAVPDWAKQDPTMGYTAFGEGTNKSLFPIWNRSYQQAFETLHTKLSEYIYSPAFTNRDRIKGIVMMSGGPWGEMISQVCSPDPNYSMCQQLLQIGYTDDAYFDAYVNWLGPMYARLFPDYPMVIQAGGGAYGNGMAKRVAEALYAKFGTRVYLKQNGWSYTYADSPNGTDRFYISLFAELSDRMRVGFEPGKTPPSGSDFATTSDLVYRSIKKTMEDAPLSYFCLQTGTLKYLTEAQLSDLSNRFRGLQIPYPDFPRGSPPTAVPSPTTQAPPTQVPTNQIFPTNTSFVQPTAPPGVPTYTPMPTMKQPYEVTNTPIPPPTQTSWIAKLFTPQEPTPTISFTNIPINEKQGLNAKDLICKADSGPSKVIRSVVYFPPNVMASLLQFDASIELAVNTWLQGIRTHFVR